MQRTVARRDPVSPTDGAAGRVSLVRAPRVTGSLSCPDGPAGGAGLRAGPREWRQSPRAGLSHPGALLLCTRSQDSQGQATARPTAATGRPGAERTGGLRPRRARSRPRSGPDVQPPPQKRRRAARGPAEATHADAAHGDDEEGLQDAGRPHDPGQPQEEDHAEDVLQAGQVDADEGAHARALRGQRRFRRPARERPAPQAPGRGRGHRRTRKGTGEGGKLQRPEPGGTAAGDHRQDGTGLREGPEPNPSPGQGSLREGRGREARGGGTGGSRGPWGGSGGPSREGPGRGSRGAGTLASRLWLSSACSCSTTPWLRLV